MKRFACLMIFILPLFLSGQDASTSVSGGGIRWTEGLNLEQVKEKARQEGKYVFLDIYTTWCGPCKVMDNSVYVNDSVGDYFNSKFISVKVQMDKTTKDNEQVKSWYNDAAIVSNQFHIEGYPTYIFLSPQGNAVHKDMGLKTVQGFISIAQSATRPGKVYADPYVAFNEFVKTYKEGKRDFGRYPDMIIIAYKLNDTAMGHQLQRELIGHMSSLPPGERYNKELIKMWSGFAIPSTSRVFNFFYKDGAIIDKVMGIKGYAADVIDRNIQNEICNPFMEKQAAGSGVAMSGMYLTGEGLETVYGEADWKQLYAILKKKLGHHYAEQSLLTARIEWYARHRNVSAGIKYALMKFRKFPPDLNNWQNGVSLNVFAFDAFLTSNDTRVLNEYISWMEKLVHHESRFYEALDTYANLLYKTGRREKAINWEQQAIKMNPGNQQMIEALQAMKLGKPTYIDQGAIWPNQKE